MAMTGVPISIPFTNNSTISAPKHPPPSPFQWTPPSLYIFTPLYTVLIIAITICNITVIHLYRRMTKSTRQKIPNVLLLNQSFVDLLIGVSSFPRLVCSSYRCPYEAHAATFFFVEWTTFLALGVLLVGTVERFACIKAPFVHRTHITKGRVVIALAGTWVITTIPGLTFVLDIFHKKDKELADTYYETAYCILIFFVLVMFAFLGSTYRTARVSVASSHLEDEKNRQRQKKVTRVFLMMAIAYMVTIIPHIVGSVILDAVPISKDRHKMHEIINVTKTSLHFFHICSALINPIITLVDKPDFRRAFLVMTGKPDEQQQQQRTYESNS